MITDISTLLEHLYQVIFAVLKEVIKETFEDSESNKSDWIGQGLACVHREHMDMPVSALDVCSGISSETLDHVWYSSQPKSRSHFIRLVDLWLSLIMCDQGQTL